MNEKKQIVHFAPTMTRMRQLSPICGYLGPEDDLSIDRRRCTCTECLDWISSAEGIAFAKADEVPLKPKNRMLHGGLAKLTEECGELQQIIGKLLNYPDQEFHPDSASYAEPKTMQRRLEEEIADVMAACTFVKDKHHLSNQFIIERMQRKLDLYYVWAKEGEDK